MKLTDIYTQAELDDEDELLYHCVPQEALDADFEIRTIPHHRLGDLKTALGDISVLEAFEDLASCEQIELVEEKMRNFDEDRIVVMDGSRVVDGNHHLVAAYRAGRGVRAIDLSDFEPGATPEP